MTQTKENIGIAIEGEKDAYVKYMYFADVAEKEELFYVAKHVREIAKNQLQHAQSLFALTGNEEEFKPSETDLQMLSQFESDTKSNLREAIEILNYTATNMYPSFIEISDSEGEIKPALLFRNILKVKKLHARLLDKLTTLANQDMFFKRTGSIPWKCMECGFVVEDKEAPEKCACCKHSRNFFEPDCRMFDIDLVGDQKKKHHWFWQK